MFCSFLNSCVYFPSSFVWINPLSILHNVCLVDMNYFNLSLFWKILISPSKLKDSFAGHIIPGWQVFYLWSLIILLLAFLGFRVCVESFTVILMCLLLYISWYFSLATFSMLCSLVLPFWLWCVVGGLFFSGRVYLEFKCLLYMVSISLHTVRNFLL
jgi:hypothetical protein